MKALITLAAPGMLAFGFVGGGLPISTDFSADTEGLPPSTGGCDEPTEITVPTGGSVLVQDSALGLMDQPVVLFDDDGDFASVDWHFPAINDDIIRVEATISTDSLHNGYCLQTAGNGTTVASRLEFQSDGDLAGFGMTIGSYEANVPFRVRMDVNVQTQEWSVLIDNDLNGFHDDVLQTGIPFVNPFVGDISKVYASLNATDGARTVAYDDITVLGVCAETPANAVQRNGSCFFNPVRYTAQPPVLGASWTAVIDNSGSGNFFAGIVGYATPADFCIGAGAVLVNLADPGGEVMGLAVQPATSLAFFTRLVPRELALCGQSVATQGFGFGGIAPLTLHNAYDLTIGS